MYSSLLALLNAYSANNTSKYKGSAAIAEEEKMSDLLLLLQILTNISSKDVFITITRAGASFYRHPWIFLNRFFSDHPEEISASAVVSHGLDIVSPLMTNELLKYPSLCVQYFKVLAHFFETYPEKVCRMNETSLELRLDAVLRGLNGE